MRLASYSNCQRARLTLRSCHATCATGHTRQPLATVGRPPKMTARGFSFARFGKDAFTMTMTNTTQTPVTLTTENAKPGLTIERTAHPEWGTFTLTHDSDGWNHRNERSESILDEGEFHFWHI